MVPYYFDGNIITVDHMHKPISHYDDIIIRTLVYIE